MRGVSLCLIVQHVLLSVHCGCPASPSKAKRWSKLALFVLLDYHGKPIIGNGDEAAFQPSVLCRCKGSSQPPLCCQQECIIIQAVPTEYTHSCDHDNVTPSTVSDAIIARAAGRPSVALYIETNPCAVGHTHLYLTLADNQTPARSALLMALYFLAIL